MADIVYNAPPTVSRFIQSRARMAFILGPVGCVDADTEYLSPQGWRRIADYDGGEVAQYRFTSVKRHNVQGRAEFVTPTKFVKLPCDEMYHLKTKYGCDQMLSAEHRVVYVTRKGVLREDLAAEIANKHWTMKAGFEGKFLTTFAAPVRDGLDLSADALRVMVAVVADGYFDPRVVGKCYINIKKPRKQERLAALLDAASIEYAVHKSAEGYKRFYFAAPWRTKEFDSRFWQATQDQLRIIADEVQHWDSHVTERGGVQFSTLNKANADFVQYAFAACGIRSSVTTTWREDKGFTEYSVITTTTTDMVSVNGTGAGGIRRDNIHVDPTPDGFKYCFSVPSTYLILRRDGCVFVTGNSGKSVGCCIKILRLAMMQAPDKDGVRRTRWAIIRNTRDQLRDTTKKTWDYWIKSDGIMGRWKETDRTYYMDFTPPDGIPVRAEVLFRALDDEADVAKVLSMELTGAWINEAREVPRAIVEALLGRTSRYPEPNTRPDHIPKENWPTWHGLFGDTNAPEMDSYWYNVFEHLPVDEDDPGSVLECETFIQPPGDSPEAENIENLATGYYDRKGRSEEWYRTMVQVQYARSLKGKPVYMQSFKYERHVAKSPLKIDPYAPVIIGLDTARTPAAVFMQMIDGRIRKLREAVAFDCGAKVFCKMKLKPILKQFFPNNPIIFIYDPSSIRMDNTDDNSWVKVLRSEFPVDDGHYHKPAFTNDPKQRILALDTAFRDWPDGDPLVEYDPSCKWLIEGIRSKYRYVRIKGGDGRMQDKPEKNNWAHVVEADQYGTMFLTGKQYDESDYLRVTHNPFTQQTLARPADRYAGY